MVFPHKAFRILSAIAGGGLIYAALFVYEDAHNKLQNHLENWWVQLSDFHKESLATHVAFLRRIAITTEHLFLRVFGKGSFTLNAFALSASISLAFGLIHHFRAHFSFYRQPFEIISHRFDLYFGIFFAIAPFVWIRCSSEQSRRHWRSVILSVLLVYWGYSSWDAATRYLSHFSGWTPKPTMTTLFSFPIEGLIVLIVLGISFFCDVAFLFVVRRSLKAISTKELVSYRLSRHRAFPLRIPHDLWSVCPCQFMVHASCPIGCKKPATRSI